MEHDDAMTALAASLPQVPVDPVGLSTGNEELYPWLLRHRVSWLRQREGGAVVVAPYALVVEVLTDPGTYRSLSLAQPLAASTGSTVLADVDAALATTRALHAVDGADHARLRGLVEPGFAADRVARRADWTLRMARGLLTRRQARRWAELGEHLVGPLVGSIIDDLLGFPPGHTDIHDEFSHAATLLAQGPNGPADPWFCAIQIHKHHAYVDRLLADRATALEREAPGDDLLTDLIRHLIRDGGRAAGRTSGPDAATKRPAVRCLLLEVRAQAMTPTRLGVMSVVDELLRTDRWTELDNMAPGARSQAVHDAVTETMRTRGPWRSVRRITTRDVDLDGNLLPHGTPVVCVLAAANRDPEAFPAAEQPELSRVAHSGHLAFGAGPHRCLGAVTAHTIAVATVEALLERPNLRLARPEQTTPQTASPLLVGPQSVLVTWDDPVSDPRVASATHPDASPSPAQWRISPGPLQPATHPAPDGPHAPPTGNKRKGTKP